MCLQPDLGTSERHGIEIERSAAQSPAPPQQQSGYAPQHGYGDRGRDRDREHKKHDHDYHGGYKKKRRGLLDDIFDFD